MGIWSDLLGGIHMWRSPLCWYSCHDSAESTPQWTQAGQTQQCYLLGQNVGLYMHKLRLLCNTYLKNYYMTCTHCLEIYGTCSPCSWGVMMSCWAAHPQQRPVFTSLVKKLFVFAGPRFKLLKAHLTHFH